MTLSLTPKLQRFWVLVVLSAGIAVFGRAGHAQAASQWQQSPVMPAKPDKSEPNTDYRYLMLDSGGSGGMFGKGDVRGNLRSVAFWDQRYGWAAGDGGVFRTDDGGLTWIRIMPATRAPAYWRQVALRTKDDVWLLKYYHSQAKGELFRSLDGGKTWKEVLQGKLRSASDMQVRGPMIRVLCGDYPSYRSDDGGDTWVVEPFGGLLHGVVAISAPGDMHFQSGYRLFVLGHYQRKPRLITSDDQGQRWTLVQLPEPLALRYWLFKLYFATSFVGAIGLDDGRVVLTRDGGRTWESRVVEAGRAITALWLNSFGQGFAAIENSNLDNPGTALLITHNGGATWSPMYRGRVQFNAIAGQNADRLWAVGKVSDVVPNDAVMLIFKSNTPKTTIEGGH